MRPAPVHYFYGGAHLFRPGLASKLGGIALRALPLFLQRNPLSPDLAEALRQKLVTEPVEAYRIDFEDGYGPRPWAEMQVHARQAARTVAEDPQLPPHLGLRIPRGNPAPLFAFLEALPSLPPGFTVVLPKADSVEEVAAILPQIPDQLRLEILVESPGLLGQLPELLAITGKRLAGLHLGPYDLLASLGVPAPLQGLQHPFCVQARLQMQLALAQSSATTGGGTAVVVDGPTKLLPLEEQAAAGWQRHAEDILAALAFGIYASWELHPLQLLSRYATLLVFFSQHLPEVRQRLSQAEAASLQATRTGAQFDDASTVRGLRAFVSAAERFVLPG